VWHSDIADDDDDAGSRRFGCPLDWIGQPEDLGGSPADGPVTVDAPDEADEGGESLAAAAAAARAAIDGPAVGLTHVRHQRLQQILSSLSRPRIW
jgi:hypothetical protein